MKAKIAILVLVLFCIGLGVGLISIKNAATEEKQKDTASIVTLSNNVVQTRRNLDDERTVSLTLETNLAQRNMEIKGLSNDLTQTRQTLTKAQEEAKAAAAVAAEAIAKRDAEIAKRDTEITKLQGDVEDKTKKMLDLNTAMDKLEVQITATQSKLAASEGDREFLLKELKRLQTEKAALEKQFNDLAVLREQVSRLRDELSIARRLDWIRQGIYGNQGMKGGELLNTGLAQNKARVSTNASTLNVELKQDGSVKVQSTPPVPAPAEPAPK